MTQPGYVLLGLAVLLGVVSAAATFALLRFSAAARQARSNRSPRGTEAAMLAIALQDAVQTLKTRADATSARADASERMAALIVHHLTAGLLVVDMHGGVVILNPAGRRLLGLDTDPKGNDVRAVLPDGGALVAAIEACLRTGTTQSRRSVEMPIGGRVVHLGVTVSPLADESGTPGAICLFSDLTAIVALEEEVRQKDTLAQLGELTAGLAHEFRNGLATIKGYGRLMDPARLPEPYRPYLLAIREETESLGRIVTNFLNFARPERVTFTDVAVGPLVADVLDDIRRDHAAADVTMQGTFGTLRGDEVLLRQMLMNLVRNAVEACDGAGLPARVDVTGVLDGDGQCRLFVDDSGPGVAPDVRDRVFRPFFTTRAGGTGLGLAIVHKVVLTHNGRVVVGVSPLGGARFELTFPDGLVARQAA